MIGIVDYGAGNLRSVRNAFVQIGEDVEVFAQPAHAWTYERVVLPGVGSFAHAMAALEEHGWTEALRSYAADGHPVLGICLGMQLLFEHGEEHGTSRGLGLLAGNVVPLEVDPSYKVPHVGWNSVLLERSHPLFAGVNPRVDYYFVHSYRCVPTDPAAVIANCQYGGVFAASVGVGNVAGLQFHPEKSHPGGLKILRNFAAWDGEC